jgi:hypothetical protein
MMKINRKGFVESIPDPTTASADWHSWRGIVAMLMWTLSEKVRDGRPIM